MGLDEQSESYEDCELELSSQLVASLLEESHLDATTPDNVVIFGVHMLQQ